MDIKKLIAVATGEIPHNYRSGLCPDELQPDSRDPDCPACKILTNAAAEHDDMVRRLREADRLVEIARPVMISHAGPTRMADFERAAAAIQPAKGNDGTRSERT